jgi:hypothetical protein
VGSVRTILASLFTALGGLFLLAMTAGVGFALYLATAPDGVSAPAEADAVADRPLLRPQSTPSQSGAIRVASASFAMALDASTPADDRRDRVRSLQNALVRAHCYDGPISGVWNDASKDAMRGFLRTANAELPVDSPDEALIAIVGSNEAATCAAGRTIETGSLKSSPMAAPSESDRAVGGGEPSLLGHAWAPAGMLTAAQNSKPADPTISPTTPARPSQVAEVTTVTDVPPVQDQPQPPSTIHFEGGSPLPAVQPPDPEHVLPHEEQEPQTVEQPKTKKTKTAKRRPGKQEDVETTISKGFDSLQRSIASIF